MKSTVVETADMDRRSATIAKVEAIHKHMKGYDGWWEKYADIVTSDIQDLQEMPSNEVAKRSKVILKRWQTDMANLAHTISTDNDGVFTVELKGR